MMDNYTDYVRRSLKERGLTLKPAWVSWGVRKPGIFTVNRGQYVAYHEATLEEIEQVFLKDCGTGRENGEPMDQALP